MQAVQDDGLTQQLRSMETRLAALRDVPQQLAAVLDSLGQVHVRLHELGPAAPRDSEIDSLNSRSDAPPLPQHLPTKAREPEDGKPALARSRSSSAANERATVLSSIYNHPVNRPRGFSVTSATSGLGRPTAHAYLGQGGRRPSLGIQSEPVEKPHCAIGAHSFSPRSPSGSTPRNKSLQMMKANSLSKVDATPSQQLVSPRAGGVLEQVDATPSQQEMEHYKRCLSLGENASVQSQQSSILSLWDTELQPARRCLLLPDGGPRLLWDVLAMIVSMFVGVLIPFELAYKDLLAGGFRTFLFAADVVWVLDIVLNFRTGFFNRGRAVLDPRLIALRYARTWLAVDVVAAWPLVLTPEKAVTTVLALKLLRLSRLGTFFTRLQKQVRFSLLPLLAIVIVLTVSHIMSCTWRLAHPQGPEDTDELWHLYVKDMYWVFMTVTTVGFGDITPTTTGSRLYAIAVMLIAPVFSGLIVSGMTHATKALFDGQVEGRIADSARFMDKHGVPTGLQRRVEQNLRHHLRNKHRMDPDLFAMLSPAVQRELSLTLLSSTVLRFPLFKGAQHGFVAELAQAHIWVSCLPGDIVVEEGQLMQEMFFLVQGRLVVQRRGGSGEEGAEEAATKSANTDLAKEPEGLVESEVSTGAWFGEACLFNDGCMHDSTIAAVAESELAVLPVQEFHRISEKFPRLLQRHRQIQHALAEKEVSLSQLAYRRGQARSRAGGRRGSGVAMLWRSRSKVEDSSSPPAGASVTPQSQ